MSLTLKIFSNSATAPSSALRSSGHQLPVTKTSRPREENARFGAGCLSMSPARYNNSFRQLSGCDPTGEPRRRTEPTRSNEDGLGASPA